MHLRAASRVNECAHRHTDTISSLKQSPSRKLGDIRHLGQQILNKTCWSVNTCLKNFLRSLLQK
eukprot:1143483-Pelagomonas_calceolata.AAC.3